MPDRNSQWYQHLLTLFAIFYESNTEGTNSFGLCWYVLPAFVKYVGLCRFCIVFNFSAKFDFVKSPEVTLCGCLRYKPSINK